MSHFLDRVLHRRRHRLARRRLNDIGPRSVLIVCRGNLCRSPYAAARLQALLTLGAGDAVSVRSAGFLAPGHRPPRNALAAARQRGVDLSRHQSCRLSGELAQAAELVLAMEPEQGQIVHTMHRRRPASVLLLGDFDPQPISTRVIRDPYGRPLETFVACYRRIDRCLEVVAHSLVRASSRARPVVAGAWLQIPQDA